jgi:predicted XRE-type DNA-binding protein
MVASQKPCAVAGCKGDASRSAGGVRGWCRKHYKRWKRNGDPEKTVVTIGGATGTCSVDGCGSAAKVKGMCKAHERRLRIYGDPNGKPSWRTPSQEAYQWLVNHKSYDCDDCLIWPFQRSPNGYGHLRTPDGRRTTASREMCILSQGRPHGEAKYAAHTCGKGHEGCVNPKHLRWASNSENQMDRVGHGTSNRGQAHGIAKISSEQVIEIRKMAETMSQREIARRIGVNPGTVSHIVRKTTWGWL